MFICIMYLTFGKRNVCEIKGNYWKV